MPDWLTGLHAWWDELPEWLRELVTECRMVGLALVLGFAVGLIYRWSRARNESSSLSFFTTLILLTPLIAIVTQVIGDNTARAFSLVGALSIVRFRTVVADTRDTAFVIFAVVIGMAAGLSYYRIALVGLVLVGAAACWLGWFRSHRRESSGDWLLNIRVAANVEPEALIRDLFATFVDRHAFAGASSARQGVAMDIKYRLRIKLGADPAALATALNQLEGVQQVEILPM